MAHPVFLLGMRETPAESFRYLRVPADDQGEMTVSCAERGAGGPGRARAGGAPLCRAGHRPRAQGAGRAAGASALRALALFAGAEPGPRWQDHGGLQAISDFMETNVPEAERARAGEVLIRILNGVLFELAQMSRERPG
jgi:cytochrome c biogenesis protein